MEAAFYANVYAAILAFFEQKKSQRITIIIIFASEIS